jgi:ABC-type Fe3+ transport system substrate-binding protein
MIGDFRERVTFQEPSDPLPDGAGGYTQTWQDLTPPTWKVQIVEAAGDQEGVATGSVLTAVVTTIRGHYHPGISTRARMLYNGKTYTITSSRTVGGLPPVMELTAVEQGTP